MVPGLTEVGRRTVAESSRIGDGWSAEGAQDHPGTPMINGKARSFRVFVRKSHKTNERLVNIMLLI